jgi:hypothetical protein
MSPSIPAHNHICLSLEELRDTGGSCAGEGKGVGGERGEGGGVVEEAVAREEGKVTGLRGWFGWFQVGFATFGGSCTGGRRGRGGFGVGRGVFVFRMDRRVGRGGGEVGCEEEVSYEK